MHVRRNFVEFRFQYNSERVKIQKIGSILRSKKFPLNDYLIAEIKLYPNEVSKENTDVNVSLYLRVQISKKSASYVPIISNEEICNQRISVTFVCGHIKRIMSQHPIIDFSNGYGTKNFCTAEHLFNNKFIDIQINIEHKTFINSNISHAFVRQQKKLFDMSKNVGDCVLFVNKIHHQSLDKETDVEIKEENNNSCKSLVDEENEFEIESKDEEEHIANHVKTFSFVLKNASSVFASIFKCNMLEKQEKKIEIAAQNVEDVDDMLFFIFTNELRTSANPRNLFRIAHCYGLDNLLDVCRQRMLENLSMENFVETVNIFDKYSVGNGYYILAEFAKENQQQLIKQSEVDQLSHAFRFGILMFEQS